MLKLEQRYENIDKKQFLKFKSNYTIEEGIPIYLNVYHLTIANFVTQLLGLGFYHTTIEINNIEYSFGSTKDDTSGITFNIVGEGLKLKLKEKIYLGNTLYNEISINKLLCLYTSYWLGSSYDPFLKNCNHFTYFLASKLLNTNLTSHYPLYVNRICDYCVFFNPFYLPIKRIFNYILVPVIKPEQNFSLSLGEFIEEEKGGNSKLLNFGNYSNSSSNSQEIKYFSNNNNNIKIFFDSVTKKNIFLKPFLYPNSKNCFLKQLAQADALLYSDIEDDFNNEILAKYQTLLVDINKEKGIDKIFLKYFKINNNYIKVNNNQDNIFLIKIKILHCISYIYYKRNMLKEQEETLNRILKLYSDDYFAIFNMAYVKFKQVKIPECEQIIKNTLVSLKKNKNEYQRYFVVFLDIINKIEF